MTVTEALEQYVQARTRVSDLRMAHSEVLCDYNATLEKIAAIEDLVETYGKAGSVFDSYGNFEVNDLQSYREDLVRLAQEMTVLNKELSMESTRFAVASMNLKAA